MSRQDRKNEGAARQRASRFKQKKDTYSQGSASTNGIDISRHENEDGARSGAQARIASNRLDLLVGCIKL
jgi:hypothetical protein